MDEFIFEEIDCHICGVVLGGVSGDDRAVVDAEVLEILAEEPTCGTCKVYEAWEASNA